MAERPLKGILDREEARAIVEAHFAAQLAFLRDLANYGSNLIYRAFDSSPRQWTDVVLCGVLLKQAVAMVDGVEVLLSAGCGHAAFLPARTAFEASIYAEWILKADSERRARRYIVGNYREDRRWALRSIPGTSDEIAIRQLTEMLGFNVHKDRPTLGDEGRARLIDIDEVLSQPLLAEIDKEYNDALAGAKKRKYDFEWYQLGGGPTSIRKLAENVGRLPEYEFFYSKGARVSHTGAYRDHLRFVSGQIRFVPIRNLEDLKTVVSFVGTVALRLYRTVLGRYRPSELDGDFRRRYLEDWREAFQNIKGVNYKY